MRSLGRENLLEELMGIRELWSFIKGRDIYTGRLHSNGFASLPFNLAGEALLRKSSGRLLNCSDYKLKSSTTPFPLEKLMEELESLGSKVYRSSSYEGGRNYYFIASNWIASAFTIYQIDDNLDLDSFDSKEGFLKGVEIKLYSLEIDTSRKLEDIFANLKLEIVGDFRGEEGIPVTFAFPRTDGDVDYKNFSFEPVPLKEVKMNYMPGVLSSVNRFLKAAGDVSKGLVVISGPVGTGKSYLVKSMLTELGNRRATICTPPTKFLEDFGLLVKVASKYRRSLLILEDIGEVVAVDAASKMQDARANLLNLTEGFLSLLNDSLVIITFNYAIDKIDPAILRPGRCIANIEIKELPHEKASKLVGFKIPSRSYTLAEVYEIRRAGIDSLSKKEVIPYGFLGSKRN